jgi:hypothetical protein
VERSWFLDVGLGVSVAVFSYAYSFHSLPWSQRLWAAGSLGVGITLFARFFLRRLMERSQENPKQMQRTLERLEASLHAQAPRQPEEQMALLEQAGALALALEHWEKAARHYRQLLDALEAWLQEQTQEIQDEFVERRQHFLLAMAFAQIQGESFAEGMASLEPLRREAESLSAPSLRMLVELLWTRARLKQAPEEAEERLGALLSWAKEQDLREEGLRVVAAEWLELGAPRQALPLLEEAKALLEARGDRVALNDLYSELVLAYCEAGELQPAASLYVTLTRAYLYATPPSPDALDTLYRKLYARFGSVALRQALRDAQRTS